MYFNTTVCPLPRFLFKGSEENNQPRDKRSELSNTGARVKKTNLHGRQNLKSQTQSHMTKRCTFWRSVYRWKSNHNIFILINTDRQTSVSEPRSRLNTTHAYVIAFNTHVSTAGYLSHLCAVISGVPVCRLPYTYGCRTILQDHKRVWTERYLFHSA